MDGCNWLPLQSSGGTARYVPSSASSQIYTLFEIDEHEHFVPAPSSSSSTFCCFSGGSPDDTSSAMVAPSSTNTSCHLPAEASSPQIPLSPIVYGNLDTIPSLEELMGQEAQPEQARHGSDHASDASVAFRPYVRHLGPKKKPKASGASEGQRAIKRAISILGRMHMARLARWQCYQKEIAAPPVVAKSNLNHHHHQQHVLSERKRREKLNNSFKALKTVLPPAPKKDKASILIRARDYINTLKSRVAELEEKTSRILVESPYHRSGNDSSEKIKVDISRAAGESTQEPHVKILIRSGCDAMDAVVRTLVSERDKGCQIGWHGDSQQQ